MWIRGFHLNDIVIWNYSHIICHDPIRLMAETVPNATKKKRGKLMYLNQKLVKKFSTQKKKCWMCRLGCRMISSRGFIEYWLHSLSFLLSFSYQHYSVTMRTFMIFFPLSHFLSNECHFRLCWTTAKMRCDGNGTVPTNRERNGLLQNVRYFPRGVSSTKWFFENGIMINDNKNANKMLERNTCGFISCAIHIENQQ